MKIVEIFDSIQGEGFHIGKPCTFVRTSGCNLACPWCDTREAWNTDAAPDLRLSEIIEQCHQNMVVITGGEPTIQTNLEALISALKLKGHYVALETNGTNPAPMSKVDWITCSPKEQNRFKIHPQLNPNELKYVVDRIFDEDVILEEYRQLYSGLIWLQPEGNFMQQRWKKCYDIAIKDSRLRVGLQLHKIMEVK